MAIQTTAELYEVCSRGKTGGGIAFHGHFCSAAEAQAKVRAMWREWQPYPAAYCPYESIWVRQVQPAGGLGEID